jgi:hypothetical protein
MPSETEIRRFQVDTPESFATEMRAAFRPLR